MGVKKHFVVHEGALASGLNKFAVPSMQGFEKGVLLVRIKNKATDGTTGATLAEFDDAKTGAWVVDNTEAASTADYHEWRLVTDLPAINYEIQMYNQASSAEADIYLYAH